MIRDGGKMVSAIFKDKKNADKFNRNNPSDVKKLLQLAKKTKFPKAIDESVNESFFVMYQKKGVFGKPAAVKYKDKKTAEKFAKDLERDGYNTMILDRQTMRNVKGVKVTEDKNQIVKLKKKVGKSEIKFYDALSKIEKKLGKKKYRAFLEKGLKDFKINAKHYDYRSNGAAEEKLFQLAK